MTGYAVFDIETTGFVPYPDSIVEIAVVHVDARGEITGRWDTLLRPAGSVGPTHIHGIRWDMVRDAPAFGDVAEHLYELFADRVAVAHNLPAFDGRFLVSHFAHAGIDASAIKRGVCTLAQARRHLPGPRYKLEDCCAHLGIPLVAAHEALADTVAAARMLGSFITSGVRLGGVTVPVRRGIAATRMPIERLLRPRGR